ncbi:mitochondrial import inner membrane translocase subunit TIM50 [Nematocida parisii]|nr:mitochondrial import inner membrane translocase subunit TIM50 [Nematocida parisii]KAI5128286.1 mitochondrial import inner membrane translocase subunit TIM50 [Nematocida parisii]KAI5140065.1 mitochondrial import inner membrane translocase subunit TIM50 [Nematocida parisii]
MGIIEYTESLPVISSIYGLTSKSTLRFPKYALGIGALLGAGILIRTGTGKRVFNELWEVGFSDKKGSSLPPQDKPLPTVFIDIEEVLLEKTWSFFILGYEYKIRPNAGAFLFQLSNEYEVVGVSSMPNEISNEILKVLDPYGCIKYRMYLPNREKLDLNCVNRDRRSIIRIRNCKTSGENDLCIDKWNNDLQINSDTLMNTLDFLLNLKQLESSDFRHVIKSYKNKNFESAYGEIQRSIYPASRQYFLFKTPNGVEEKIKSINRSRIEEYEIAREYIENKMKIHKIQDSNKK